MSRAVSEHARATLAERIGREITEGEWGRIVSDLKSGRSILLSIDRDALFGRGNYAVCIGGYVLTVVWQPDPGVVIAVLPDTKARHRVRPLVNRDGRAWLRGSKRKTSLLRNNDDTFGDET